MESANKLVVEARLKGSGMHWAREHVNPMVALRTIVCSDRWEEAWPQISQRIREKVKEHTTAHRHKASPEQAAEERLTPITANTAPPLKPTKALTSSAARNKPAQTSSKPITGRRPPAANHPWRRMAVGRNPSPPSAQLPRAKI